MVRFSSASPKSSTSFSKNQRSSRRTKSKPAHGRKQMYDHSSKNEDSAWSSQSAKDNEQVDENSEFEPRSSFDNASKSSMAVVRDLKPDWLNGSQQGFYINIPPLPTFKGLPNECPIKHLSRFNKVCRANNAATIEDMIRIFPVTLEDEACMWYDLNIEPYSWLSWEEITEAFSQAYGGHYSDLPFLKAKLANLTQGKAEPIRSYFLKLQWLLNQCPDHGIPEEVIKGVFVGGMRSELKKWVVSQEPESLNNALRMAFSWERMESLRGLKGEKKCGFCDGGSHEEEECEVRERMRELWRKSSGGECDEREEEVAGLRRRSAKSQLTQSQCSKHQCWKKIERDCSRVSASTPP